MWARDPHTLSDDSVNELGRHLRHLAGAPESTLADAALLDRFAAHRDETAFAELVRRYGPAVFGVCQRVAGNADADDAFQATFLVLVRKAKTLRQPALGGWLYGVARRVALKVRADASRRRVKEASAARPERMNTVDGPSDVLSVVECELSGLPRRYREPLVLCVLCGRSRKDVAAAIGVAEGTLSSRMAKARAMLAERLRRRGITAPAVTALVAGECAAARAAVPVVVDGAMTGDVFVAYVPSRCWPGRCGPVPWS